MQLEIATHASIWRARLTIYNNNNPEAGTSPGAWPGSKVRTHALAPPDRVREICCTRCGRRGPDSHRKPFPARVGPVAPLFLRKTEFLGRNSQWAPEGQQFYPPGEPSHSYPSCFLELSTPEATGLTRLVSAAGVAGTQEDKRDHSLAEFKNLRLRLQSCV